MFRRNWSSRISVRILFGTVCLFVYISQRLFAFTVKPQLSGDFLPQTWEKLREAVISIQNSKPAGTSLEELYQAVQNLCSNQMASTVYMKLRELTDNHVSTVVLQFLHPNYDNLTFLKMTEKCWENFCNQMVFHHPAV